MTAADGGGLGARFPALRRLRLAGRRRRRIRALQQLSAVDCGPACLAMVLGLHGREVPLEEVREVVGSGRLGASAADLLRAAEWYRLRGRGVKVENVEDLRFLEPGTILHWQFNHFVVLERAGRGGVQIVDPTHGRRQVGQAELRSAFTGVALILEPREDFEPGAGPAPGLGRYLRPLRSQAPVLSRLVVMSVVLQLLALALPLLTGLLVDRVVPRDDYRLLGVLGAGLAMVVVFHFLSALVRSHLLLQLRTRLDTRITLEFLDHLVDLPYAFFQQRSSGDLLMRLNSNATVREILTSSALSGVLDGLLVSLYLALLLLTHPKLGILVTGLGLARVLLFVLTRRRHQALMSKSLQVQARSRGFQVQMLAGIETLKAMGAEKRAVERWAGLFVDELNVELARGRLSALFDSLLGALATGSPLVVLAYGGMLVMAGELSLGTMLAMSALATGFFTPLSELVSTAVQMQLLKSYLDRLSDVMETPKEQEPERVRPAAKLAGGIRLEEVSFRYSPASPIVVDRVSLAIEPGTFVAIVGPSGAGKTTMANLLAGLYRPTTGRILFDGQDLAGLDLRSLRRQLGIVNQQPFLFGSSIRDNIALASPEASFAAVVEAAKLAHIHADIMAMPMGYETLLADGGASLSGGQRQRIALARALVHRPAILLLDEATSNLDAITERAIQRELGGLSCTRIVIAHRLSTIRSADLIVVMDGGRVVDRGNHAELTGKDGRYLELVSAQLEPGGRAASG